MTNITLLNMSSFSSVKFSLFQKPNTFTLKFNLRNTNSNVLCSESKVADKLNNLTSEFTSLSEPIDRVKRLLHYASLLPPLRDSERIPANRVAGCATQVWVVAEVDERWRMRFRADSDSEISKGFCWCLVWMLDGAKPEEVVSIHRDDLANINVGLGMNLKAHSRTNTWHNVLFSMQAAAKDFLLCSEQNNTKSDRTSP